MQQHGSNEIIILSEVSQKLKLERQHVIITYTWNLKYDTNERLRNRNSLTAIGNRLVFAKGEEVRGGKGWEFGSSRCKHVGWIERVLL